MKADVIVIGGGLSGLTAGISLIKAGKSVVILSSGQSSLHFHSGSFDLLGFDGDGHTITAPLEGIKSLDAAHPYNRVDNIESLASEAKALLLSAGIKIKGDSDKNHYRISPMGVIKPAWLTLDEYLTIDDPSNLRYKKALLVNFTGFLDFPMDFISDGLRKIGMELLEKQLSISSLMLRRQSPSEMRSANVAAVLSRDESVVEIADKINRSLGDSEIVLMPAIAGLNDYATLDKLRSLVNVPLYMIATLPPSVSGVRVQSMLRRYFENLGGCYLLGSRAKSGIIEGDKLKNIAVSNLPDEPFVAQDYILATGSFQSHGLVANYEKVYEPIMQLDTHYLAQRAEWTRYNVFDTQPYISFGVKTDQDFHALKDGVAIENLYAVGSVLCGHNAVKQADGTGVSLITALAVANDILKKYRDG